MIFVAAATLVGASLQSATGFGFALILSPAILALLDPYEAVTALLVLGFTLNLLLLFSVGDRTEAIRWRAVGPMLVAALPGLALGLLVLAVISKPALQLAVGAAVLGGALVQAAGVAAPASRRDPTLGSACAVGLASGALTTSTTVSGPPLVLWLQWQGVAPNELRASLAAAFLGLSVAGAALLAAAGVLSFDPAVVLPLLLVTCAGHALGTRAFARLADARRFRSAVLALVAAAGLASIVAGLPGVIG